MEMPDPHAYDEARYEDSLHDDPPITAESRYVQDLFELYDLLGRNASYTVRTREAEAERDQILREIAVLESLSVVGA